MRTTSQRILVGLTLPIAVGLVGCTSGRGCGLRHDAPGEHSACEPPVYGPVHRIDAPCLTDPWSIACCGEEIVYATTFDGKQGGVVRIDLESGTHTALESPSPAFGSRLLVAATSRGSIYVSDHQNSRIVCYESATADPSVVPCPSTWGAKARPLGIAARRAGGGDEVYVAKYDEGSSSASGVYRLSDWQAVYTTKEAQVVWVACSPDDGQSPRLAVGETVEGKRFRARVLDLATSTSLYVADVSEAAGPDPGGVALGPDGDVLVVDQPLDSTLEWAACACPTMHAVADLPDLEAGGYPVGVALTPGGTVLIASGRTTPNPAVPSQILVLRRRHPTCR